MKVLVADDSATMRMIVRLNLRKAGLDGEDVREAANGHEALAVLATWQPDVVLCDWNMPGMDGIDVLRTLRRDGNPVPVGFLTADVTDELRAQAMDAGALFVLGKPFDGATLRSHLARVSVD